MSVDGTIGYGAAEAASVEAAVATFGRTILRELSFCCTPIELLSNDGELSRMAHATGFFYRHNDRQYLVTNWHVVSGRNPLTGLLESQQGYIPQRISFHGFEVFRNGTDVEFRRRRWRFEWGEEMAELLSQPQTIDGRVVDLWAFPLPAGILFEQDDARQIFVNSHTASCFVNDHANLDIGTASGDDCFIVGYPLSNYSGAMFPVWKRGSIASEPLVGLGAYGAFLIDAATTKGMSGSPVYRFQRGPAVLQGERVTQVTGFNFIGIYGGRLQNRELESTNLGYAWLRSDLPRLIDQMKFADFVATAAP